MPLDPLIVLMETIKWLVIGTATYHVAGYVGSWLTLTAMKYRIRKYHREYEKRLLFTRDVFYSENVERIVAEMIERLSQRVSTHSKEIKKHATTHGAILFTAGLVLNDPVLSDLHEAVSVLKNRFYLTYTDHNLSKGDLTGNRIEINVSDTEPGHSWQTSGVPKETGLVYVQMKLSIEFNFTPKKYDYQKHSI